MAALKCSVIWLGNPRSCWFSARNWPTDAVAYHLECAGTADGSAGWFPIADAPVADGDSFTLAIPVADERKFFWLAQP
jgi:hypothetical protein